VPNTLLLVDDSVTIQRVIELTFADEDVQVIAVSDGDQAIARLQVSPPDIVLADIGMPGKNGYEVAQYIRQTPALAQIPVVLLTGAFEPVDQARATEAGCDGVLAKPFEPQLVISRVKELLAKRPGAAVPAASSAAPASPQPSALQPAGRPPTPPAAPASPSPGAPSEQKALDDYFDRLDAAFSSLSAPAAGAAEPTTPASTADIDWFSIASAPGASAELWDPPTGPADEPFDAQLTYASPQPPVSFEAPPPGEASALFEPPEVAFEPSALFEPVAFETAAPGQTPPVERPAQPYGDVSHLFEPPAHAVAAAEVSPEPVQAPPPVIAPPSVEEAAAYPGVPAVAAAPPPSQVAAPAALPSVASLPPLSDAFAALLAAETIGGSRDAVLSWPAVQAPAAVVTDDLVDAVAQRVLDRLSDRVIRQAVAEAVSRVAEQLVRAEIERIKAGMK
jgi:CheY-like chemotaxis protein